MLQRLHALVLGRRGATPRSRIHFVAFAPLQRLEHAADLGGNGLGDGARTRRNTISAEVAEAVASAPVGLHRVRFVMLGGALRPAYLTDVARRDLLPAARTAPTQNGEASA